MKTNTLLKILKLIKWFSSSSANKVLYFNSYISIYYATNFEKVEGGHVAFSLSFCQCGRLREREGGRKREREREREREGEIEGESGRERVRESTSERE